MSARAALEKNSGLSARKRAGCGEDLIYIQCAQVAHKSKLARPSEQTSFSGNSLS